MKTLFVSLAALLFAFFVGCQSSITEPVDSKDNSAGAYTSNDAFKNQTNTYPSFIELEGSIEDPSSLANTAVEIKGVLKYSLEAVYFDAPPPAPQSAIRVKMKVSATLHNQTSSDGKIWTVEGISENLVYIAAHSESAPYLNKSFRVQNTGTTPLDLVMKFQVDAKRLTLISMNLTVRREDTEF